MQPLCTNLNLDEASTGEPIEKQACLFVVANHAQLLCLILIDHASLQHSPEEPISSPIESVFYSLGEDKLNGKIPSER